MKIMSEWAKQTKITKKFKGVIVTTSDITEVKGNKTIQRFYKLVDNQFRNNLDGEKGLEVFQKSSQMPKAKKLPKNAGETLQAEKTEEIKEKSSFDNVSRYFVKLRRSQNNDLENGHVDKSNIVDKSTIEK